MLDDIYNGLPLHRLLRAPNVVVPRRRVDRVLQCHRQLVAGHLVVESTSRLDQFSEHRPVDRQASFPERLVLRQDTIDILINLFDGIARGGNEERFGISVYTFSQDIISVEIERTTLNWSHRGRIVGIYYRFM